MNCSVCNHPERPAIDRDLVSGATLAAVSKKYNLSTSAVDRHKAHLRAKVHRAKTRLQHNLQQYGAFWLSRALDMVERIAQAAEAEGNFKVVLQAVRQGTSLLNIINKQDCQFDDRMVYAILTSSQWAAQSSLLPDDPDIMAMCRESLAGTFAAPCSESSASPLASTPIEELDPDLVQALLPPLDRPTLATENRKPKTENRPFKQWEKSGKSAGKSAGKSVGKKNKNKEYQKDRKNEKISQNYTPCTCVDNCFDDLADARLELATLNAIGAGRPLPEIFPEFLAAAVPGAPETISGNLPL